MQALDRPLPNNPEAERMTLGAMILDNRTIAQAAARLHAEDYFLPSHRAIYRRMLALHEAGHAVDPLTLQEELSRTGELEACGGPVYIASLFDGVPRFSNLDNYLRIVKGKATQRQIIRASNQAMAAAFDGELEATELLSNTKAQFEAIDDPELQAVWEPIDRAILRYFEYIDKRLEAGRRFDGLALGIEPLDEELGGLPDGTLNLAAARPGMGKTALLASIAEQAPQCPDNPDILVAFFSAEMPTEQLVQRTIASKAGVPIRFLRNLSAFHNQEQSRRIKEASKFLSKLPIVFDGMPGLTPARFKAEIRRLQRENPKKKILALVDYLQLMQPDDRKATSAYDRASLVSTGLMRATKELGCTTIAAAQLRRPPAGTTKKPTMDELRDSGQIEQDAAVIMFPYRPSYFEQQENYTPRTEIERDASIIVGKGRFSGFSEVKMHFDPKTTRYVVPDSQGSEVYGGRY